MSNAKTRPFYYLIKRIKYNTNSKDLIPVILLTAIKGK